MKRLLFILAIGLTMAMTCQAKEKKTIRETITVQGKEYVIREDVPVAPDFTLKDLEGKEVSLSDFKGKWVVLDFWGSWCVWCIRGIPEMKKIYSELSPKVEFIGIDCHDTEEAWKEAVKKYELPWVNVRTENDDLIQEYEVQGFPTKVIVDPFGGIYKVVVGEDPEFYKALREVVK